MLPKKGKETEETTTRLDITSLWSLCSFSVCKIWSFSKFSVPLIRYTYVYSYQIMAQTTEFSELNRIKEKLSRIERLVDGWNRGGDIPSIERDMALEELRHLYDAILDYRPVEGIGSNEPNLQEHNELVTPVVPETEEALVVAAAADTYQSLTDEVGDAFDDALDIDALLGLTGDDPIVEEPLIVEPIVAAPLVADPIVEEPATESVAEIIRNVDEDIASILQIIINNRYNNDDFTSSLHLAVVHYILNNLDEKDEKDMAVKKIKASIIKNFYKSDFDVTYYLNESGYNEDYIRAHFKKITGVTPIQFLTKIRIKHAKNLINAYKNSYSLAYIAESCGYDDYIYFSRKFKEVTGLSPQKYKNSIE